MDICPICATQVNYIKRHPALSNTEVDCPRCQLFSISDRALDEINYEGFPAGIVCGWLRSNWERTGEATENISPEVIEKLCDAPPVGFRHRMERYLSTFSDGLPSLNADRDPHSDDLIAVCYCSTSKELQTITSYLVEEGYIHLRKGGNQAFLTAKGHMFCDELRSTRSSSSQGFVAMWFDPQMSDAWSEGIEPALLDGGYVALRIDNKEHINDITDEIMLELRNSKFVVADLTGSRAGVYYEAGFAHGLNKPVFYTCRKSDMENVHFDIRQIACIDWETPADLRTRLGNRIQAVIGRGPAES